MAVRHGEAGRRQPVADCLKAVMLRVAFLTAALIVGQRVVEVRVEPVAGQPRKACGGENLVRRPRDDVRLPGLRCAVRSAGLIGLRSGFRHAGRIRPASAKAQPVHAGVDLYVAVYRDAVRAGCGA